MQHYSLIDSQRPLISTGAMKNRLPERLREIVQGQEARGGSQIELARKCGLSAARFNNYVQGTRTPDLDTLMRMAKALGSTPSHLLGFNEAGGQNIANVLIPLLELAGMDQALAEAISDTALEALKALAASPDEGDAPARSRMAAQLAWQLRGGPKPLQ